MLNVNVVDKQLSALLTEYPSLPMTDSMHASLVKFAISALTAGEMALWMAHGRKVLERSWERPVLGIELTGALSDLSWGGWKMLAASHVSGDTHKLLETHPAETLELLAALHKQRRLNDMDIVWKQRFQAWAEATFASWEHTDRNVCTNNDSPYSPRPYSIPAGANAGARPRVVQLASLGLKIPSAYSRPDAQQPGSTG